MTKKIQLPSNEKEREYILYLYKNRNEYHNMPNQDIDNLIKLMAYGKLEKKDYPEFKKIKKCKKINGMCFSKLSNKYSNI